ncbi:hypothetical protein [Novipirellula aureliae]|uniref:hypothetical protein n=1 Tax=Novipirellula aureliae TaxID=2527966 RepID=UPI0011B74584|nr:hypothetical protein [Novipirellula aureliae]
MNTCQSNAQQRPSLLAPYDSLPYHSWAPDAWLLRTESLFTVATELESCPVTKTFLDNPQRMLTRLLGDE